MSRPGSGHPAGQWALAVHRPDPTTVVLRPVGRLHGSTAPALRRLLAESIVFHSHVVLDLGRVVSGRTLASALVADARQRARSSRVVLTVLDGRPVSRRPARGREVAGAGCARRRV